MTSSSMDALLPAWQTYWLSVSTPNKHRDEFTSAMITLTNYYDDESGGAGVLFRGIATRSIICVGFRIDALDESRRTGWLLVLCMRLLVAQRRLIAGF
jgi:hypothetical protein